MKLYSRFAAGVFVLCAVVFLSGCAANMASFLAQDDLQKDQGLIMIRVRIKDHTGALVYKHRSLGFLASSLPSLIVQKDGERDTNDKAWIFLDTYKNSISQKEDGTFYFDQYYYIAAKPGRYFINYLNLKLDTVQLSGTYSEPNYLNGNRQFNPIFTVGLGRGMMHLKKSLEVPTCLEKTHPKNRTRPI